MRFALAAASLLLLAPFLASPAAAWLPVCIEKEVGDEGGKVHAEVWATCGAGATVEACPKDAFCHEISTEDLASSSPQAATCHHTVSGHGFDTWLCIDPKGPIGCMVYSKTYRWEGGWTYSCIA